MTHILEHLDKYIHAFDPGLTTGFAVVKPILPQVPTKYPLLHVMVETELKKIDGMTLWRHWTQEYPPTIVIWEGFRLYPHKAQDQIGQSFPSCEVIGILKYLCFVEDWHTCEQMASCKTPFAPLDELKAVYPASNIPASEHIRDALRHAAYWWFKVGYKTLAPNGFVPFSNK